MATNRRVPMTIMHNAARLAAKGGDPEHSQVHKGDAWLRPRIAPWRCAIATGRTTGYKLQPPNQDATVNACLFASTWKRCLLATRWQNKSGCASVGCRNHANIMTKQNKELPHMSPCSAHQLVSGGKRPRRASAAHMGRTSWGNARLTDRTDIPRNATNHGNRCSPGSRRTPTRTKSPPDLASRLWAAVVAECCLTHAPAARPQRRGIATQIVSRLYAH